MGRSNWFRKRRKSAEENNKPKEKSGEQQQGARYGRKNEKKSENKELRTAAVLFCANTKDGMLAKNLREVRAKLRTYYDIE